MPKISFLSFCVSLSLHSIVFFIPFKIQPLTTLDADVIKGPSSIEVSLVYMKQKNSTEQKDASIIKDETKQDKKDSIGNVQENRPVESNNGNINQIQSLPIVNPGAITNEINAHLLNRPPFYPALARVNGWQGEVILIADINTNGQVRNIKISTSSGYPILDNAAFEAVRKWRFKNTNYLQAKIPIEFVLTDL